MGGLVQDLRYALRQLRSSPGFTAVAVITLALGIGANTAIFCLINAVLLRPLPFPEPDRLVAIWERRPSSRNANLPISGHEFAAWSENSHVFERMALFEPGAAALTGRGEPETIGLLLVSADFFPTVGVHPAQGRAFVSGEDRAGHDRIVVLSDGFWRRHFAGDKRILGQTIALDNQAFTVVGVMPHLPQSLNPDLWLPMDVPAEVRRVGKHSLNVIGRLKSGISLAQAQADLDVVARDLEQQMPNENTDHHVSVVAFHEDLVGDSRRALVVLMGAVGFVLLIACLNVASLLFARTTGRLHEVAVRSALGASRLRMVRQLVAESLLLAAIGGGVGLLLAVWLIQLLPHVRAVSIPLVETVTLDAHVLIATALLTIVSGLACGLAPAIRASKQHPVQWMNEAMRASAGPGRRRLGAALVASEVALALVLLVGAGLLMKSFVRLVQVDAGFNTRNVLGASVALPPSKYARPEESRRFFADVMERIKNLPGVQSVGATTLLPLNKGDNWAPFSIEGRPDPPPGQVLYAPLRAVTPDFFRTLQIPLRRGRFFGDQDARVSVPLIRWYPQQPYPPKFGQPQPLPVAVISNAMARQYWPNEDPIGRRFRILFSPWITIVGVVGDVKHNSLDAPSYPHIYLPYSQEPSNEMTLVVRSTDEPLRYAAAVREQIRSLDPDLPVTVTAMDEVRSDSVGRPRFYLVLVGTLGALALTLAAVGIFGLASYSVSQRVSEIGVRMALGANRGHVLRLVLVQGLGPTLIGVGAGTAGALVLARLIKSLLYSVSPADPLTLVAVGVVLIATGLLASYIPARRAMKLDPMVALRYE